MGLPFLEGFLGFNLKTRVSSQVFTENISHRESLQSLRSLPAHKSRRFGRLSKPTVFGRQYKKNRILKPTKNRRQLSKNRRYQKNTPFNICPVAIRTPGFRSCACVWIAKKQQIKIVRVIFSCLIGHQDLYTWHKYRSPVAS